MLQCHVGPSQLQFRCELEHSKNNQHFNQTIKVKSNEFCYPQLKADLPSNELKKRSKKKEETLKLSKRLIEVNLGYNMMFDDKLENWLILVFGFLLVNIIMVVI